MKHSEIFSKQWCDLLFEGRNKSYGAYEIRRTAGRRYKRAVTAVAVGVFVLVAVPAAFSLYFRYRLYKDLEGAVAEVRQLKKLEREDDCEVKHVSAGRGAPAVTVVKDATEKAPDIVEEAKKNIVFGAPGAETFIVDDRVAFEDRDTLHNRDRLDLPIEGPQLIAVEVVEEMPKFPGGLTALMQYLEKNIVYPQRLIDAKIRGEMEVTFFVLSTGDVADARITKSLNADLDKIVLRAVRTMPRWEPAHEGSVAKAVCITLPVHVDAR